jgi:hypothetical protein
MGRLKRQPFFEFYLSYIYDIVALNDGEEIQTDSIGARIDAAAIGEGLEGLAEHRGGLGSRRKANPWAGRTLHESPTRKTPKRGAWK